MSKLEIQAEEKQALSINGHLLKQEKQIKPGKHAKHTNCSRTHENGKDL